MPYPRGGKGRGGKCPRVIRRGNWPGGGKVRGGENALHSPENVGRTPDDQYGALRLQPSVAAARPTAGTLTPGPGPLCKFLITPLLMLITRLHACLNHVIFGSDDSQLVGFHINFC